MRYLLLFILFFLILRLVSHAYLNRPSMRGSRNPAAGARTGSQTGRRQSSANTSRKRGFQEIEDADYEIIEEEEPTRQTTSGKS